MELLLSGIEASAPIIDAASALVSARQSMGGITTVGPAKKSNKRPRKTTTTTATNQGRRPKKHQQQHQAKLQQAAMLVFGGDAVRGEWPATTTQQDATVLDSHSLFQQLQKPQPSSTLQSQQHGQLFQHQQYQLQLQQQLERHQQQQQQQQQRQQQVRDHHSQSYDSQSHQSQHHCEPVAQPDAQRHTAVIRPGSSIVPEPYQRQPHLLEIDPRLRGMPGVPALMQGETVRPLPTIRPKTNARFPSPAFPSHDERVPMWSPQQLQQQQQQRQQEAHRQQVQETERQRRQQQLQRQIQERHAQQVQHRQQHQQTQQLHAQQVLAQQKKIRHQQAQQKQQLQQAQLLQAQLREAQHRKQQQQQQQQQRQQLQLKRAQPQQLQLQQQQRACPHQQQSLQGQTQRQTYQQPLHQVRQVILSQQPDYSVHDQVQTHAHTVKTSDQHERLQLWQEQALGIQPELPLSLSQGLSQPQPAQAIDNASRQQQLRVQHSIHRQLPPPSARDGRFEQALWTNQDHKSPAAGTITSNFQRLQPMPEAGTSVDTSFPLAALPSLQFRSRGGDWVQPLAPNGPVYASRQDGILAGSVSAPNAMHLQQKKPTTSAVKRAGRLTAGSIQAVGGSRSTGQQSDPLNGVRHAPPGAGAASAARPASGVVPGLGIAQSQNQKILSSTRLRKIAKKTSRKERQQLQQTLNCQPPLSQDKHQLLGRQHQLQVQQQFQTQQQEPPNGFPIVNKEVARVTHPVKPSHRISAYAPPTNEMIKRTNAERQQHELALQQEQLLRQAQVTMRGQQQSQHRDFSQFPLTRQTPTVVARSGSSIMNGGGTTLNNARFLQDARDQHRQQIPSVVLKWNGLKQEIPRASSTDQRILPAPSHASLSDAKSQSLAVNALSEHQKRPAPLHKENKKPRKRKASIPVPMPQKHQEPMSILVDLTEAPANGMESSAPVPSDPRVDQVRAQSVVATTPGSPTVSPEISDPRGLLAAPSARPATETVMIFCKRDFLRFQAGQLWRKYREIKRKRDLTLATVTGRRARYLNARYQNPDQNAAANSSETSHARQAATKRARHSIEAASPSFEESEKGEASSCASPPVGSISTTPAPLCVSSRTESSHEGPVVGSAHEPTPRNPSLPEEATNGIHVGDVPGDICGTTPPVSDSGEDSAVKKSPKREATVTQSTSYTASSCADTTFVIIDEDTFATGTTSSESSATMEQSPLPECAADHKPPVSSHIDHSTMESGRNSGTTPPVEPLGVNEPLGPLELSVAPTAMDPKMVPHAPVAELHFSDTSGPQRSTIPGIRDEVVI